MPTKFEVTKAIRRSDLPAAARLVMFVLADVAETGTAEIPERFTPSLKVLAEETGLNESTVKRYLNALESDGWVERRRPTIDDARLKAERTRYRLTVPLPDDSDQGAEEAPEGAQEAQEEGAEEAPPGAGGAQEGAQEAQTRAQEEPRPGRTVRPLIEEVNQVNQGQSLTAPAEQFDAIQETAQPIVAGWIDYCAARNVKLPRQLIGQYAKSIKAALDEGFDPRQIRDALVSMFDGNVANRPSLLPNRLVEIQTGPEIRTNGHNGHKPDPGSYVAPSDRKQAQVDEVLARVKSRTNGASA